jgi:outer membrane protein OmpA-like peptidoglycan-associated protein
MALRNLVVVGLLALPVAAVAAEDPAVAGLNQRLVALQADMRTAEVAAYEKLQAQQAIGALAKAKRKDLDNARYLAERRVAIAEAAARTALARREIEELERTRSELLIEASRRDALRARQEAERLRVQTQIQAEEAERLRQAAEAETLARQDAETALTSVAGRQQQRLSAAQQNAAKLAREEAELVSGQRLPGSKFDSRGEVFTFAGDAFAAGQAALSAGAGNQAKALAEYLNIGKKGRVTIEAYDSANGVGQRRAQALKDALVAAGVAANRIQVTGRKAASTRARSAEVIVCLRLNVRQIADSATAWIEPLPEPFCRRRVNCPGGTSATRTAEGRAGAIQARTRFRRLPVGRPDDPGWFRRMRARRSILQRPVPSRPGRSCFCMRR